jgi:xanthine dehydrogenase accessory factor
VYEIADRVRQWLDAGRDVTVAQVVATRGFSSRDPGRAAAWTELEAPVGALLEGVDVRDVAGRPAGIVEVTITEDDAVRAGLACGGVASILVRPASAYPVELWAELADRRPVCLVTDVDGAGPTTMYTPQTIRGAGAYADPVPRLFARGTSATALTEGQAVVALWPVPTLVVVGDGLIATALANAGALLDWTVRITPEVDAAVATAQAMHHSDAVVVLSHDRAVDGPALAAALDGHAGYVGALGSRRTQAARREWLTEHGVAEADQDRIHGPAGLDIDAHTPAEIAVSIVAEILAARADSTGGSIKERGGPIHTAGVNAPPPRYG